MVAAECAPFVKTGGLADAVAGLAAALARAGHDVRILMPLYGCAELPAEPPQSVTIAGKPQRLLQRWTTDDGVTVLMLAVPDEPPPERVYTGDQRDGERYIALAEAAAALTDSNGWRPDIVHCHDWHAALVPDALAAGTQPAPPTVLTLHNIGYQGSFPPGILRTVHSRALAARLRNGNEPLNFLRRGLETADAITTVSPTYAREILSPQYGMGLESLIGERSAVLSGILNGVDYGTWDPRSDPYIAEHYSTADTAAKLAVKQDLCERIERPQFGSGPLIGIVSRLAEQKGIDIFSAALDRLVAETEAAFVVLGSGHADLERDLDTRTRQYPDRIAFRAGHDEALAHLIIAGSDFLLMPSRYEPCGLTQLYAMRYGTVPIVRRTGGLADTVEHFDAASGSGNGCVFNDPDVGAVVWAVATATAWMHDPETWLRIRSNAMAVDHSWSHRVDAYVNLYFRVSSLAGQ